VTCDPVSI